MMKRAFSILLLAMIFAAVMAPVALADVIEAPPVIPVDDPGSITVAVLIVAAVVVVTVVLIVLFRKRKKAE